MATLLRVIQDTCEQISLAKPTTVIGNTSGHPKQLLSLLQADLLDKVRDLGPFSQFLRSHTITLVADQANYAMPEDFDIAANETFWDQTNSWELIHTTPKRNRFRAEATITTGPRKRYIIKGWEDNQFYVSPTPATGEAGNTFVFDYYSETSIRPTTWVASTAFAALSYCSYNGNIYQSTAGGTTGATAPTHTTGDASDDTVTWTYISAAYDRFVADTDELLLPQHLYVLGLKWLWARSHGLPHDNGREFMQKVKRERLKLRGSRRVNLASPGSFRLNIPEVIPTS